MKKAVILLCLIVLLVSAAVVAVSLPPLLRYRDAQALMAQSEYAAALETLERLGSYRDSEALADECREALLRAQYLTACALYDSGQTEQALSAFEALGGYRDSEDWLKRCENLLERERLAAEYTRAIELFEKADYAAAAEIFEALGDYEDADEYRVQIRYLTAAPGDTFFYGSYPQTGEEPEPLEWLVLARDGRKVLVVSLLALDASGLARWYPTWEDCPLRETLNGEFFQSAFTAEEQARILTVTVVTPPYTATQGSFWGGDDTEDRLFLLSLEEIGQYLPQPGDRLCRPSGRALAQGAATGAGGTCSWWTRSPGGDYALACRVLADGTIDPEADAADETVCVRPAMWIEF